MFFSKFLIVFGATAASALAVPANLKHPAKAVEKRAIEDAFKLQVQGGPLDGKWVVGAYDTTGAFVDTAGEAVEFSLSSGTLQSPVGNPGILGLPTIAWIFFDNISNPITGCSIDPVTSQLTGCTATYGSTYNYDVFGAVVHDVVWAIGNSGTNWPAQDGHSFNLTAFPA
ncbi:uncharacterized protein DFL_003734 [Arthrobotrys flagrans]|uniref:Ubiquitin 3 binding protein But2 C-terminal domain-containing protein n=1 Tax=Arthrobotrys flagrans TaxID=97331 RepID=A0A437A2R9_ARTFL|nr:hypothetical protein DFL_003734 [Arthrobotrys flagrans]